MSRTLRLSSLLAATLAAPLAHATFHTLKIDRLYSNADGTIQYVVLRESAGFNGENFLPGPQPDEHARRRREDVPVPREPADRAARPAARC